MYLRYAISFILSFALNIFLWLTCWLWGLLAAIGKYERLPGWLALLHTHDDWVYGFGWPKDNGPPPRFWDRWKIATWWIARNPGYGFDAHLLGILADDVMHAEWTGHVPSMPWPTSEDLKVGIPYRFRLYSGGHRFGYRRNLYLTKTFYIKMWFGWHYRPDKPDGHHMLKIAFGPKWGADAR